MYKYIIVTVCVPVQQESALNREVDFIATVNGAFSMVQANIYIFIMAEIQWSSVRGKIRLCYIKQYYSQVEKIGGGGELELSNLTQRGQRPTITLEM